MKALVTGGAGFIGSNIVDALVARGDDVAVLDDLSTGSRENLASAIAAGAALHRLDVVDGAAVRDLLAELRPHVVFHLAAQIDVRLSVEDPGADARANVEGTVNVLEAARAAGVARVVLSSTGGAIYGEADVMPTPEDAPSRPLSPYGQAKHAAEGYCSLYAVLHGLSTIALRYANVYGPRQDPLGEGGVIAIYCNRLATGEQPAVYGDGRQTRDFVYVEDVVRANLLAAERELTGSYNIGTGAETSVLELAEQVGALAHGPFEPRFEPARAGEVRRSCLDPSRTRAQLGWSAETSLADGLRRTLAHQERAAAAPAAGGAPADAR
ncbi:MAG TPA: NAD-dependent epimerase/dehydratase family protein [Conexibacter sp.]|nr:NAD-dependent epimerase/dehydratase family protein [Conexibacter sp.]